MTGPKTTEFKEPFISHIGLGKWGKNIFRNLYDLGVLRMACDLDENTVNEYRREFPDFHFTTSYEEILADSSTTAVAISTPATTHHELAMDALRAGKDIFVEKPLALTIRSGLEILNAASSASKIAMVGHVLNYHPAVIKLKELISKGELGKIQYFYSNRLNIGRLRTEENILWSFAPHDISVILSLFGEMPTRVSAFGGDYVNRGIYDTSLSLLEFSKGVKAHIFVNWLHPFKEQKLVVVGSKAMAVFDDCVADKLVIFPHSIEWKDGKIPIASKADQQIMPIDNREPLKQELLHFIECCVSRQQPLTNAVEGVRVLKVLQCLEQALKDQKPVEITETIKLQGPFGNISL